MYTNWLTNSSLLPPPSSSAGLVHTPPDVVLKIGPHPGVHFVAHSSVLMMHSGYLRSSLQIDERGLCKNELPIHLTNITADQFAPLLTYMYTGYLDLRIENIFSILLATHVLHIPRALDICREFLSRTTHAESYVNVAILQSNLKNQTRSDDEDDGDLRVNRKDSNKLINRDNDASDMNLNPFRIIRPIPSKPTISNLGVIVPPTPHILLPSSDTPFRSLNNFLTNINSPRDGEVSIPKTIIEEKQIRTDKINENTVQNVVFPAKRKEKENPKNPSGNQQMRKHFVTCVIRKENTISNESKNDKIIIDVASCDGPVKFRRVLNDAYEPNLNKVIDSEKSNPAVSDDGSNPFTKQLTIKSNRDCYPFRQQIEKNLNQQQLQQQQEQQQQVTESENCNCTKSNENKQQSESQHGRSNREQTRAGSASDIYSCVYCKHTFKSQYCYEKHAKRHINPLVIEATKNEISQNPDGPLRDNEKDDVDSVHSMESKREVRPLDMNVQYYPCKTCGSKFPSYYFVHKHRKLCHANEDTN